MYHKHTKLSPAEILKDIVLQGMALTCYRKPGELVLSRSKETREKLRELKSDDIKDIRHPFLSPYSSAR